MMKKCKYLMLCTVLAAGTLFMTACGNDGGMKGTEAPYEDQTNRKVNDRGARDGSDSLKDAGKNLWDSVEDTGDAIRNGIDNLGTDMNNTNNTNNTNNANMNHPEDVNNTNSTDGANRGN